MFSSVLRKAIERKNTCSSCKNGLCMKEENTGAICIGIFNHECTNKEVAKQVLKACEDISLLFD